MHHQRNSSAYFFKDLIGCFAVIARPKTLISFLLAASFTIASSGGTPFQSQNQRTLLWSSFPRAFGASSSADAWGEEQPCDNSIPASAYATDLLPRQPHHEGGDSCPSEYEITTDENRIPAQMPEAKCKCIKCQLPRVLERRRFKCFPIYHMVPVMRRIQNEAGQYGSWMYALERISVGCTCRRTRRCRRHHNRSTAL